MQSQWRKIARDIIYNILQQTNGESEQAIRKALRDAYPFGVRKYHPYKIWLDEIARQRCTKKQQKKSLTQLEISF